MKKPRTGLWKCMFLVFLILPLIGEAQSVSSLTLINATTDEDIGELTNNYTIDLATTGHALNVRANTEGTIGSVQFTLDGQVFRTEGVAPYALAGDDNGDYRVWTPSEGEHTLKATAYTEANAGGTVLSTVEVIFTVTESQADLVKPTATGTGEVTISGELKKWHKITLDFDGPAYKESDNAPNPFLDFRLQVTFTNGETSYTIPGYFAADGNAAETSLDSGNVWRVHFAPDQTGEWTYTTSFRFGSAVAISEAAAPGEAIGPIDGKTGSFTVASSDKSGRDFRSKGRLQYTGGHHLQFADSKEYFIKGGPDAPENLLAYEDFDNTPNEGNRLKNWTPHANDWKTGDPSWQNGKGTEIIGAVNYLAAQGLNVFSFLTMNIGGDDKNVFPYVSSSDFKHFDCSKLDQWEILFEHADKLGMYLHFKTQETENDQLLDGGAVGTTRKLYYRELIARFAHHLALNWNLGEENTQTTQQRKDMAAYFAAHDPYQNHIVIHTYPDQHDAVYPALLGDASALTGASIQTGWNKVHENTLKWRNRSAAAGKPWVVANDEQGGANTGVPDDTYTGSPSLDGIRKQTLWGNLMAGGAGVEYYFGYNLPHSDLTCQDFRSRATSWKYVGIAIDFFQDLPVNQMAPADDLLSKGWCLTDPGNTYLVYLPEGGTTDLTVAIKGTYDIAWFDPRNGGELQTGSVTQLTSSGTHSLGTPPSDENQDWAILITRATNGDNVAPTATFTSSATTGEAPVELTFDASASSDTDGSISTYEWDFGDGITATGKQVAHTYETAGTFTVTLIIYDDKDGFARATQQVTITRSTGCGSATSILSTAFNKGGFYVDNYTGTDLLAIQPDETNQKPVSATATTTFEGESCTYNLTFHGIGESDGEAAFQILVNDVEIGAYNIPLSTQNWEMGDHFNLVMENVALTSGDEIKVVGTTASADGKEWSRARWLKLDITPTTCAAGIFEEKDGYVVVEAEDAETIGTGYVVKDSYTEPALGTGHLQYTGSNSYGAVPQESITEYQIKINTPGTYQFKWRSRNGPGAVKFDEENDSWLSIEADRFYGTKGGTEHTFTKGDFIKVWIQDLNKWSWNCFGEHHGVNGMNVYATFDIAGVYTLKIAGRSHGHPIDRFALYLPGKGSIATNDNTKASSSSCGSGGQAKIWASPKNYELKAFDAPFEIDGEADEEWKFIEEGTGEFESAGKDLPEETDLSMKFSMTMHEDMLYLLANITDDQLVSASSADEYAISDNLALFFNPDNEHAEQGAYGTDALHIRMPYGANDSPKSGSENWTTNTSAGFEYSTKATDDGYLLEAKIPLSIIGEVSTGQVLGFEVQVNDNDGNGLENSLAWANDTKNNAASTDTRKFGTLTIGTQAYRFEPKTAWQVIYVDSEATPGNRDAAIDGDPSTFWHTEWKDAQPGFPHEIQIDFGDTLAVAEVHYLHRQDEWGPNGAIGEYEIYVSESTSNWGDPVAKGELEWPEDLATNYKLSHVITLNEVTSGRYMRLVALSETQNIPEKPFTAIAELDVVAGEIEMPEPPAPTLGLEPSGLKIYPSPSNGAPVTIQMESSETWTLTITDISGKKVYSQDFVAMAVIKTAGWPTGLYQVRIQNSRHEVSSKLIISR